MSARTIRAAVQRFRFRGRRTSPLHAVERGTRSAPRPCMHTGPVCQSCAMPLDDTVLGTDESGGRVSEYCHYCFREGRFTNPSMSLEQMIDHLTAMSSKMNMDPAAARALAQATLPKLRRWATPPVR